MSRCTTDPLKLSVGVQYEDRERNFIAYIEVTPMQPEEVIRYRLVVKEATFEDRGTYYSVKVDCNSKPIYVYPVLIDGLRPTVKRNAIATDELRHVLCEFLKWYKA